MESNGISTVPQLEMQGESLWATDALNLLARGEFTKALHFLNVCIDEKYNLKSSEDVSNSQSCPNLRNAPDGVCPADEVSLLEKRCLVHMKLQNFDEVLNDAKRVLEKRTDHSLAYKCLLVALCKTNRLEPVREILKLWRNYSPHSLDLMQCRTKIEALMYAVKNGIEPSDAFSKVEDQLGLSYEWLISRKLCDPLWRCRPLPRGQNTFDLCLQHRFGHCSLLDKCPDAHGEQELEEWKSRSTLKSVALLLDTIKMDSGEMYIRKILDKVRESGDTTSVISEVFPDELKIRCSKPLETSVEFNSPANFKWTFSIETQKPLKYIALLHELHREYFYISSACMFDSGNNEIDLLMSNSEEVQVVEINPLTFHSSENSYTYRLNVLFKPDVFGAFRQTIVFDIGEETKFIKNISVDVVPAQEKDEDGLESQEPRTGSPTRENVSTYRMGGSWNYGNAEMVDAFTGEKVASHKLGFQLIGMSKSEMCPSLLDPLTKDNYKEKMRFFLTQEERARQEILAKYNLTTPVTLMEMYTMNSGHNDGLTKYALDGSLYGKMKLFRDVSEDTAVGRLILRGCNYVLLTKTEEARKNRSRVRVYLAPVSEKTKNDIYIEIGKKCVEGLGLKSNETSSFEIQFQLDRTAFMEMKAVIDKLEDFHLDMLFPDFHFNYHIPWTPIRHQETCSTVQLNPKQREALIAITTETDKIPPILVIGPFGTGKTFTLAQCIRKLLTQPNIRIMVCTHSNSAADLYIKEYLHPWVEEGFTAAKPLRIYYHMRNINSVHPDVLEYCKIEKLRFRPPTLEEILAHRVIVVTLSTSYMLMQLDLPKDTFSHILLDEAAQAMESEAITPLMSAGASTKLVLAGDHMQLSPELFSDEAKSLHPSLLERLHNSYPDNHPCKLMLCENYRSHSAIIDYVSEAFYSKKLQCSMEQPVHSTFFPMTFFAARGEEVQEQDSTSYFNMAEVFEVADKVKQLITSWPEEWGPPRHESAIGVLTPYSDQVSRIRSALRKKGLYSVSVERVLNVQGKQFRAVFLSTVRSFRPWVKILPEAVGNEVDLGFFSNPKLLNTALTRAQSLVAVVGDPVSLCSEGKCRNLWKDFITISSQNKSLYGMSYTQLEQSIAGLEMRMTWGFNPLADEFQPQSAPKSIDHSGVIKMKGQVLTKSQPPPTTSGYQHQVPVNSHLSSRGHPGPLMASPVATHPPVNLQQQVRPHPQSGPKIPVPGGHGPFQNPGTWGPNPNMGGRPPVVHNNVPSIPPNFPPYRQYYPSAPPLQAPNQITFPVGGYQPRQGIIPQQLSHQPPVAQVLPPSFAYIGPRHSDTAFPMPMKVGPHPTQQSPMIGGFPPSQMAPKPTPHLAGPGVPGSPILGRNMQPGSINGNRSPMLLPMNPPASSNGPPGSTYQQHPSQFPEQEQFSSELPLYRRQGIPSNSYPQNQPQQNLGHQNQALHPNLFPNLDQSFLNSSDSRHNAAGSGACQPAFSMEDMQALNELLVEGRSGIAGNQNQDAQSLHSKLIMAVNIAARTLSDNRNASESRNFGNPPIPTQAQNSNLTTEYFAGTNSTNSWMDNSFSRIPSLSEQLNECRIAEKVNGIWSSLGLNDDDPIPAPSFLKESPNESFNSNQINIRQGQGTHNQNQNSSFSGYLDTSSNQSLHHFNNVGNTHAEPSQSSISLNRTDCIDPWASGNLGSLLDSHSQNQRLELLGPAFGQIGHGSSGIVTRNSQLSSGDRESFLSNANKSPDNNSAGRSYANVVKRASTGPSSAGTLSETQNHLTTLGGGPYNNLHQNMMPNDFSYYFQQNEEIQQHMHQNQNPPVLPQSIIQDSMKKKNKKK